MILTRSQHAWTSKDHSRTNTNQNFIRVFMFTSIYEYLWAFQFLSIRINTYHSHTVTDRSHAITDQCIRWQSINSVEIWILCIIIKIEYKILDIYRMFGLVTGLDEIVITCIFMMLSSKRSIKYDSDHYYDITVLNIYNFPSFNDFQHYSH